MGTSKFKLPEVLFRPVYADEVTAYSNISSFIGTVAVVEPDFEEPEFLVVDDTLCEYCGKTKGYPTNLGIHVALLCDECAVVCEDDIIYDLAQGA